MAVERLCLLSQYSSRKAAADLFGVKWEDDPRCRILYYGIDFTPFHECVDLLAVRAEFDIPADAFVIGHVGRFVEQKNHEFLIEIAAKVAKIEPKMRLLLVGDYEDLGDAYSKVGDKQEAIAAYQTAADIYQKKGDTQQSQAALDKIAKIQGLPEVSKTQ